MNAPVYLPPDDLLPDDPFDQALVANVGPSDWVNPRYGGRYNLVVIGAGPAGLVAAIGAAGLGAKVALVERHRLGGDCLNVGCVPSKALVRSAREAAHIGDAARFGASAPHSPSVDFAAVMQRVRRLRSEISRADSAERCRRMGVDVYLGEGRFNGSDSVQVRGPAGNRVLEFKRAAIATGTRPGVPDIPGLAAAGFLTNETVFTLTRLPPRLAIIGGGPVGCELAQAFARFGSRVVLLEAGARVLIREVEDAARIVERALVRDGVEVFAECEVQRVHASGGGKSVIYRRGGREGEWACDAILVAAGRAPNVEGLNLEGIGVRYDGQKIEVDDRLRTANPGVYACGDVCSDYKFTHVADALARIVVQNALFFGRSRSSALTVPWCTYTDPELAHVGLGAADAERRGIAVETLRQEMSEVDRAILDGRTEGFVQVVVRKGTDRIVGATIVAPHAGEMISELTLAIAGGIGLKRIAKTIHPYPTQADAIRKLGDLYNRGRLTPLVRRLAGRFLAWRR